MANLPISLVQILSVYASMKINRPMVSPACSDLFSSSSDRAAKHLRLLNGVALLMVTEGQSDVAAVTVSNHAHGGMTRTVFHMMKNRDCNEVETAYYENFVRLLNAHNMDSKELQRKLEQLIITNCRAKILNRASRLQKAVKEIRSNIPTWSLPSPARQDEIAVFKRLYPRSTAELSSWPDLLDDFLVEALRPESFAKGDTAFLLMLIHYFVSTESLMTVIGSPKLGRRLKKLSEYARILMSITKHVTREKGRRIYEIKIVSFSTFSSRRC